MNYRVEDISIEGISAKGEQDKDWLEGLFQGQTRLEFQFVSPLLYSIFLSRSAATIVVAGSINVKVKIRCSRCLEEFIYSITPEFNFTLSPSNSQETPFEKELQQEDMDKEFYEGDVIDLGRIIHNQIVLSIPINPLCRENCKGLCPYCGTNKNRESCECSEKEIIDSRLAGLKNFLKK